MRALRTFSLRLYTSVSCTGVSSSTAPTGVQLEPTVAGGRGPAGWRPCPSWQGGSRGSCQPQGAELPCHKVVAAQQPCTHGLTFHSASFPAIHLAYRPEFPLSHLVQALLEQQHSSSEEWQCEHYRCKIPHGIFSQCKTAPREESHWKGTSAAVTGLSQKCLCCGCLVHGNWGFSVLLSIPKVAGLFR